MGAPRLTEDQRCLIIADYLDGHNTREIAERYGVSKSYPSELAVRAGFHPRNKRISDYVRARRAGLNKIRARRDWLIICSDGDVRMKRRLRALNKLLREKRE